eukprot:403342950
MSATIQESDYFRQLRGISLNNLQTNSDAWTLDFKYATQAIQTLERVQADLDDGILLKFRALREKELDQHISKNCFQNKSYNFQQALKCQDFHLNNDFKLKIINSFFSDHVGKHVNEYQSCWQNPQFESLKSIEAKDKSFLECHNRWTRNIKENVEQELQARARQLLQ